MFTGIQGIIQAYQNCVPQISLWGPTNTAPIIYHVAKFAAAAQQEEPTKGAHVRTVEGRATFVLEMLSDFYVCCKYSSTLQTTFFFMEGNNMNPDHTAPKDSLNPYPTTIFCPGNVVCFLCLLHIFIFSLDYIILWKQKYEP